MIDSYQRWLRLGWLDAALDAPTYSLERTMAMVEAYGGVADLSHYIVRCRAFNHGWDQYAEQIGVPRDLPQVLREQRLDEVVARGRKRAKRRKAKTRGRS